MSDSYIRLIPDDQRWQPTVVAAASAAAYVTELFSGQDDAVERVEVKFYDRVTLIDAGEYTTRIACSRCEADISLEWLGDVVRKNGGESFDSLGVLVPCCGAAVELDSFYYEEPIGFARFEVSVMNPTRARFELDRTELARVARLLGHPVVQVLAHY
ncbi:hypothetical protein [Micromonospora echinaurantiaca]|uniref:hypothetical protein n=1 Tax=Micromonospora echinaurantiaca TaxID=47857 RepID=UPI003436E97D